MRKLLFSLALFLSLAASAQETYRFAERDTCSLYLDIWRPAKADSLERPAIMFVFGGGFVSGSRTDPFYQKWYQRLNKEGYPVVAIDYRLGMKGVKVGNGLAGAAKAGDAFLNAQEIGVEDVCSAICFLHAHPELGIDTDNLVLSGNSAGAIISVATAYHLANGTAPEVPDGFRLKGVMSFAGAVISTSGAPVFKSRPCPILFLHGTEDQAVAYKQLSFFGRGLWGSSYLARQLQKKGWDCVIWRFKGRTHDVAAYMDYLWPIEKEFLEKNVMQGIRLSLDATLDDPSLPTWKNISLDDIY